MAQISLGTEISTRGLEVSICLLCLKLSDHLNQRLSLPHYFRGQSLPYAVPGPADNTTTPLHRWLDSATPFPVAPPVSKPHRLKNTDDIVIDEETRLARQYLVDLLNSSPVASRTASASGDRESALSDPWASSEEHALIRKYLDEPDEMSGLESLGEIHAAHQPGIVS